MNWKLTVFLVAFAVTWLVLDWLHRHP
jgi:hypothetical protein